MNRRTKIVAGVAAVAGIGIAAAGVAVATSDDSESPITGDALRRASAAAVAHTGGGRVTDTEVGDEESYYEVEVTLGDGRQVDVQLDEDFNVVSSEADDDTTEDEDS